VADALADPAPCRVPWASCQPALSGTRSYARTDAIYGFRASMVIGQIYSGATVSYKSLQAALLAIFGHDSMPRISSFARVRIAAAHTLKIDEALKGAPRTCPTETTHAT